MRRQWMVVLQDIPVGGIHWDGQIPSGVMQDPEIGETAPLEAMRSDLTWIGNLVRKGDVYRLNGNWSFRVERSCSRCNESIEVGMDGNADYDFQLGTGISDQDTSFLLSPPGELNLVDVLREDIWLAWPQDVVCRPDCQGLCPVCGCNRNQAECRCHESDCDNPFAALGKLDFS